MYYPANIVKHLRLLLTAITLVFVVGLNNREVTTIAVSPAKPTEKQVNKAAAEQHGTIKQKVSFEATYAGVVLPPATLLPPVWQVAFSGPIAVNLPPYQSSNLIPVFFSLLLSTAISPNAP